MYQHEKKKVAVEFKELEAKEQLILDASLIKFESQRLINTRKLNDAEGHETKKRLSKRGQKKLDKLETATQIDQLTKEQQIE